ncbi:MAG: DPP IV N-terminal domain-containing protein [Aggregatilineales bacterium]
MTDHEHQPPFPLEATAVSPPPGYAIPNTITFSNDDTTITYLFATPDAPIQQLYAFDVNTGKRTISASPPGGGVQEDKLTPEEELRRQRERMLAVGITHYQRVSGSDRILVPLNGSIYVQDSPTESLRLVVDTSGQAPALTPRLTEDGQWIAYVQDAELYVISADGNGTPRQLTAGARGTGKTNGLADYIAQEELGRGEGFWWSDNAEFIAYTEVDETHIPAYRIVHQGKEATGDGAQEDHHYPFAGEDNPRVRLAITARDGGEPIWMNTDFGEETYIARVFWWQDGSPGAEILNRLQNRMWLARFDIETGERITMIEEQTDYWINKRNKGHKLLKNGDVLMTSERDGYNHLYLYGHENTLKQRLSDGGWVVDSIAGVDEDNGIVYFTGNRENPTEAHLYRVPLAGGEVERITQQAGTHAIVMDHTCTRFVDTFTSLSQPPIITLRDLQTGEIIRTIHEPDDPRIEEFNLTPPEIITLQNRIGDTLFGAIYRPPSHFGDGPFPTIVYVYGGPGPQMVTNSYALTANLMLQYLSHLGFLVFRLDNRGSARRGLEFEGALKHAMGTIEVDDQVDGVRWLTEQGLTDPARVGIYGWSYGGYMTLMCLTKAADTFSVGVAGAPVTHWDGYDTAYTERYMNTPQKNPDGYADGSVMAHVDKLNGKLMLIHGMLDENVHFRHTARLINALNRARKAYDLLIFPDERHMPRNKADRVYLNERLIKHFQKHL